MPLKHPARSLCLALILSLYGSLAVALPPTVTPDLTLHFAGSTIQDNNLVKVLGNICVPGTLDQYKDADATGKGTYYKAFYCQVATAKVSGLTLNNPRVLILKRNRSGAITGVYPMLETDKPVNFMGIANLAGNVPQCSESPVGSLSWTCRTDRPGDIIPATPDLGVLDIDPQIFRDANYNPVIDGVRYQQPTPSAIAATLTVRNAGGVIQNTPVSRNLRDALQEAEVAQGRLDPVCLGDEARRETAYCMPSLSKAFLSSIFAGRVAKWSDVRVDYVPAGATAAVSKPLTAFNAGSLTTDLVHICRRNKGASTQAAINAYFLNNPCAATGSIPVEISNPVSGPVVVAPSQVSAEESCLADFSDGANNSTFNPGFGQAWAVGMLTTERNTKLDKSYRYIRIDGALPTPDDVAAGRYQYFSEAAYVWRKVDPRPTGDALTLIQKIATEATTPTMFGQLNAGVTHAFGQGSFIGVSGQDYPPATPFDPNAPVSAYTHAPDGSLDNCILPQARSGLPLQF